MSGAALAAARVLVTGATGFIGRHVVEAALAAGAEVHSSARRQPSRPGTIGHACDVTDGPALAELMSRVRPDVVFHLAGHVTGKRTIEAVLPTFEANVVGVVNLLLAAARLPGTRLVLAASMEEPPAGDRPAPAAHPYAASKLAASVYAGLFADLFDADVVLLRTFLVYGPGATDEQQLVPYVARSVLAGRAAALTKGDRLVDWVFVDDVAHAYLAAATSAGTGYTVDVGSGVLHSVRDVAERIAALCGCASSLEFGQEPARAREHSRVADIARSRDILGWEPRVGLDEGLRRTVEWYRARPLTQDGSV